MPRFTQDQPFDSELNKNTQESLRQNLLSNIENVNPVDGVLLPGGGVGIIKSENIIIPIKRDYDYAGTVNQDGFVAININANADKCLVVVDGQPSYRSTPSKFVFSRFSQCWCGTCRGSFENKSSFMGGASSLDFSFCSIRSS